MRASAWVLCALSACAARPPSEPPRPVAPTLVAVHGGPVFPRALLRGEAPDALVVRLTVDRACAGPTFLDVTPEQFAAGVEVELVVGPNVFTARSISATGQASDCSAPLELERTFLDPPQPLNSVMAHPLAPRTFSIRGRAPEDTRVRLHAQRCNNPVLEELDAAAFLAQGFTVSFQEDGFFTFGLEAVDAIGQVSPCWVLTVRSKTTLPTAALRWVSPQPTPEPMALLEATGDFSTITIRSELGCQGQQLGVGYGSSFRGVVLRVSPPDAGWVGPFSAYLLDDVGNSACIEGLSLAYDSLASTAPVLQLDAAGVQALVHPGRRALEFFTSADCSGLVYASYTFSDDLAGWPLRDFPAPDAGVVLTARSYFGLTPDDCSTPLVWR